MPETIYNYRCRLFVQAEEVIINGQTYEEKKGLLLTED